MNDLFEYFEKEFDNIIKKTEKIDKSSIKENIYISKENNIDIIFKYFKENQNLEKLKILTGFIKKFFIFMKKISGKYPKYKEIYIVENRKINNLDFSGINKGGNWIIIENFDNLDYWTFFHEMIHIYNFHSMAGFIVEGFADFLSYLFLTTNNFSTSSKHKRLIKKHFRRLKTKDFPLYDSLKKDYNKTVDKGYKNAQAYSKSFLFWKMIYEEFGIDPIKDAFRMSIKNKKMNAVNVKNILKKYTDQPISYMSGWILTGDYYHLPKLNF